MDFRKAFNAKTRIAIYRALIVLVFIGTALGLVDAGRLADAVDAAQRLIAVVSGVLALLNIKPDAPSDAGAGAEATD